VRDCLLFLIYFSQVCTSLQIKKTSCKRLEERQCTAECYLLTSSRDKTWQGLSSMIPENFQTVGSPAGSWNFENFHLQSQLLGSKNFCWAIKIDILGSSTKTMIKTILPILNGDCGCNKNLDTYPSLFFQSFFKGFLHFFHFFLILVQNTLVLFF
jgi:hypothetical protein